MSWCTQRNLETLGQAGPLQNQNAVSVGPGHWISLGTLGTQGLGTSKPVCMWVTWELVKLWILSQ